MLAVLANPKINNLRTAYPFAARQRGLQVLAQLITPNPIVHFGHQIVKHHSGTIPNKKLQHTTKMTLQFHFNIFQIYLKSILWTFKHFSSERCQNKCWYNNIIITLLYHWHFIIQPKSGWPLQRPAFEDPFFLRKPKGVPAAQLKCRTQALQHPTLPRLWKSPGNSLGPSRFPSKSFTTRRLRILTPLK